MYSYDLFMRGVGTQAPTYTSIGTQTGPCIAKKKIGRITINFRKGVSKWFVMPSYPQLTSSDYQGDEKTKRLSGYKWPSSLYAATV